MFSPKIRENCPRTRFAKNQGSLENICGLKFSLSSWFSVRSARWNLFSIFGVFRHLYPVGRRVPPDRGDQRWKWSKNCPITPIWSVAEHANGYIGGSSRPHTIFWNLALKSWTLLYNDWRGPIWARCTKKINFFRTIELRVGGELKIPWKKEVKISCI